MKYDSKSSMRVLPYLLGSGRGQGQKHALPEMQEQGGQGEAEADTKSGAKEAKGGEEMTREEVVQAALTVERWCAEHYKYGGKCDCPFAVPGAFVACRLGDVGCAEEWELEEFLRTRGLKHD